MENKKEDKLKKIQDSSQDTEEVIAPIKIKAQKGKKAFPLMSGLASKEKVKAKAQELPTQPQEQLPTIPQEPETIIEVEKAEEDSIFTKESPKRIAVPSSKKKHKKEKPQKSKEHIRLPSFPQSELERFLKEEERYMLKGGSQTRFNIPFYSLVVLTKELSVMLQAGVSLTRVFSLLSSHGTNPRFRSLLVKIYQDMHDGKPMSVAMRQFPKVFSPTYVAMVEAGEAAGNLPAIMGKLAFLLEREMVLRSKVKSALTYPMFVVIFSIMTFFLLMTYVLPVYFEFYRSLNMPLPLITRILMFVFELPKNPYFLLSLLFVGAGGWFFFCYLFSQATFRLIFDEKTLRIPIFGKVYTKVIMTNFCRGLGMMLASGVNHLAALEILKRSVKNVHFSLIVHFMIENMRIGFTVTQSFREALIFPAFVINMASVGEETGDLDSLLLRIADFYETEIDYLLSNLASVLEPFLLIGMGLIVGVIVVGLFLPLYGALEFLR